MSETERHFELEEQLIRLYRSTPPDSAFADRLETQLAAKAQSLRESSSSQPGRHGSIPVLKVLFHRPAWAVALILALALALSLTIVGPRRVLAELERLLGYIPGLGFVDTEVTRFLHEPVEVRREGVILRVEQVIADGQQTRVDIAVDGLPAGGIADPGAAGDSSPYLIFPDGSQLHTSSGLTSWSEDGQFKASLKFYKIPADVTQITLIIPRLPNLPEGVAPERWEVPLTLAAVSDKPVMEPWPFNFGPSDQEESVQALESYSPVNASATTKGITVQVIQVSQSAQETGIQLRITWEDPKWTNILGLPVRFRDDLGNHYVPARPSFGGSYEPESPAERSFVHTYRLAPFQPQARQVTLSIDQVLVESPNGGLIIQGLWEITWELPESEERLPPSAEILPTPTRRPDSTMPALAPELAADPALKELQSLLAQGYDAYTQEGGWLHLVVEKYEPSPVDKIMSADFLAEHWALLNAQGELVQEYSRLESGKGSTISEAVFKVNRWYELKGDFPRIARSIFYDLAGNFADRSIWALSDGAQIQREEVTLDGETVVVFTLFQFHDPPIRLDTNSKDLVASEERAYVDPLSGRMLILERERFFSDGTAELFSKEREVLLERVDAPPPDVLKTISQVIMP